MTAEDRSAALSRAQDAVNNSHRRAAARGGARNGARPRTRALIRRASTLTRFVGIDTKQPWFNELVPGIGGLPRKRVVNIYGPPDSGKSSFALRAIAAVLAAGGVALIVDSEGKLDPVFALALGVDTRKLFVIDASGRKAFEAIRMFATELAKEGITIDLIVIDTVTALPTGVGRGALPTLLNSELPAMLDLIRAHNACLLLISQERAIPMRVAEGDDQADGARIVGTGGFGLGHGSTVVVELIIRKEFHGADGLPTGHLVEARLRKLHAPGSMGWVTYVMPKLGVSGKELQAMYNAAPDAHPVPAPIGRKASGIGSVPLVNGASRTGAKALAGTATI